MAKKNMTIEDLAVMVKRGFDEMGISFYDVKKDLGDLRERLKNLEKITLKQYNFEIQELKRRVKHPEDLFAIK